jgi:hypothetical protein
MFRLSPTVVVLTLAAAVAAIPAEAAQRAFVASTGSDDNIDSGCGLAAPCRSFASAETVVSDGGEIVALDAAGYGPIGITKNVTITANPGFYAGIAVPTGNGVTIATIGVNVTIRGLNINGTGGDSGVVMIDGNTLSIENCVISNFPVGSGVDVSTAANVRIVDSLIRDSGTGVYLRGGATATISGAKILGNSDGVYVDGTAITATIAAISDSIVMGPNGGRSGVYVVATNVSGTARMSVTRSTLSNNAYGAFANGAGGVTVLTLSNSMFTGNTTFALYQTGAGSTLESLGNNTVRQNGADTSGTITTVSPM